MNLKRMRQALFTETNRRMNAIVQAQHDSKKIPQQEGAEKARAARKRNKRDRRPMSPTEFWTKHDELEQRTKEALKEGGNHGM